MGQSKGVRGGVRVRVRAEGSQTDCPWGRTRQCLLPLTSTKHCGGQGEGEDEDEDEGEGEGEGEG